MNKLKIFESKEFGQVRIVTIDNEPWFVGKDICSAFGDTNYRRSLLKIDDDEKGVSQIDTPGGKQNMVIVNESGLYSLLFSMEPQKANMDSILIEERVQKLKKFKRWVTSEVLPSIRKHGAYMTEQTLEKALTSPDFLIQLATTLKEEQEKNKVLETEVQAKNQIIGELQPKADYTAKILDNSGLVTITQIAKDYGMSGQAMNELLHKLEVQFKQSGQWLLYSKYHDCGYTHSNTVDITHKDGTKDVKMNTKWTQKGRLFLYGLLKESGYLPLIEQNKSA